MFGNPSSEIAPVRCYYKTYLAIGPVAALTILPEEAIIPRPLSEQNYPVADPLGDGTDKPEWL